MADFLPRTERKRAARGQFRNARAAGRRWRHWPMVGKRNDAHPIKAAQRDVADRRRDLPGEIELARLAEGHGLAGIEENAHRQLALLLVELEEQPLQPAVEIPVEVAEIVAVDVVAVIGELDRLPARAAAALALAPNSWPAARRAVGIARGGAGVRG